MARADEKAATIEEVEQLIEQPRKMTEQEKNEQSLLLTLAELGGLRVSDDDLIFHGRQFVIPETMSPRDAIDYLEDHIEQQEEETRFDRTFKYRPWDGAHALQEALRKVFGTAGIGKATWSFFSGKTPPEMISINIGPNETTQVPWGKVAVPLFKGTMYLGTASDPEYGTLFRLVIDAPRKYRAHVEGLFRVVQDTLERGSIYKGRAIDGQEQAEFLSLSGVRKEKVVYSDEVMVQLEANLWSLLRHSQTMRDLDMPLKRAVLLEGPYGTGKTLAAFLTAQVATANGWTFLYCRPNKDELGEVMSTARLYQPAVVFFEDVDILAETGERDRIAELLDTFDGITAKGTELLMVVTTNHRERIHKGMVRPGRLDAMIHIGALDQGGCERMIKAVLPRALLSDDLDFAVIYAAMEGYLPAFVTEAASRAMRYGIARNDGIPQVLTTEDFVGAAEGLRPQFDLMEGAGEGKKPEGIDAAMRRAIDQATAETRVVIPELGEEHGALIPKEGNGKHRVK